MDDNKNAIMLVEAGNDANCASSSSSASCNPNIDNCKDNRGSSRRTRHSNKFKASMIEFRENESNRLSATQFCTKHDQGCNMTKNLSTGSVDGGILLCVQTH